MGPKKQASFGVSQTEFKTPLDLSPRVPYQAMYFSYTGLASVSFLVKFAEFSFADENT